MKSNLDHQSNSNPKIQLKLNPLKVPRGLKTNSILPASERIDPILRQNSAQTASVVPVSLDMSKYRSNKDVGDESPVEGKLVEVAAAPPPPPLPEKREGIFSTKGRKNFGRFLQYTLQHKALFITGNISLILTSATQITLPFLAGKMIDIIANKDASTDLNQIAGAFILMGVISSVFSFIRTYAFDLLGERVMLMLRSELFTSFLRKDVEFYDTNKSGELMSRITSDTTIVQNAASDSLSVLVRNVIQFIGSFVILWVITYELTLIMFGIVPPLVITIALFIVRFKKYSKEYQDKLAVGNSFANEAFGNIRVVKGFAREKKEAENFKQFMTDVFGFGKKKSMLYGSFLGVVTFLGQGAMLCVIWYGGTMVLDGKISTGQLSSFILYTITMSAGLLAAGDIMNQLITAVGVSEKLFEMMDLKVSIQSGNHTKPELQGNIKFENVTFEYPTKPDVEVLKKISFEAKTGQVVALVGGSGSGKSSTVSLLERFYDVKNGQVSLDGVDIRDYDLDWLHEQIGFVSQEPTLFSGSLRENITYGVTQFTQEDIDGSLQMANAKDFVYDKSVFPEGLDTVVGERGVKLSGGQKQRIAIARALIKNPRILIFDEATSALDAESEFHVQSAIDNLMKQGKKTIILIAHRLSTIRDADAIVVFGQGEIKEIGTHSQLLAIPNGVYAKLIARQITSYEETVKPDNQSVVITDKIENISKEVTDPLIVSQNS